MKRELSFIVVLILTAALLAGCGGTAKLAEGFDEQTAKAAAENAVTTLNGGDYDAFCALGADSLKAALTPEVIKNAVDQVSERGGFR
jgi:predicted small secreted protein